MNKVIIPQINANEDSYVIQEIFIKEGEKVTIGSPIVALSSSKSVEQIKAEADGFIHFYKNVGDDIKVGAELAAIFASENELNEAVASADNTEDTDFVLTKSAAEYAKEHNISNDDIKSLGKKIIKKSDIENICKLKEDSGLKIKLTANQRGVANTVKASVSEIPKAFQVNKFDCTKTEKFLADVSEELEMKIGYEELLVCALFKMYYKFSIFYGKFDGNLTVTVPKNISVGITLDCGSGLFVPSFKEDDTNDLETLAEKMLEYKMCAARGEFSAEQLAVSSISIALNNESSVVFVDPVIMPNQIAIISLCGKQEELCLEEDGSIKKHCFLYVGIAYDHRVVNGSQAMDFMSELKRFIEDFDKEIFN